MLREKRQPEVEAQVEPARQARFAAAAALREASKSLERLDDTLGTLVAQLGAVDGVGPFAAALDTWRTARQTARARHDEAAKIAAARASSSAATRDRRRTNGRPAPRANIAPLWGRRDADRRPPPRQ